MRLLVYCHLYSVPRDNYYQSYFCARIFKRRFIISKSICLIATLEDNNETVTTISNIILKSVPRIQKSCSLKLPVDRVLVRSVLQLSENNRALDVG